MTTTRSQGLGESEQECRMMPSVSGSVRVSEGFQGMSNNQKDFAYFTKKSHERSHAEKCHRTLVPNSRLQTGIQIEQRKEKPVANRYRN